MSENQCVDVSWNSAGFMPPVAVDSKGHGIYSPYSCSILQFVKRFAISDNRRLLIEGFLKYRLTLRKAIGKDSREDKNPVQWVGGSFVDDIELQEEREPRDIDVVTIYPHKLLHNQLHLEREKLSYPKYMLSKYGVDSYFIPIGVYPYLLEIKRIIYWHTIWSHQREGDEVCKGFLQIPLYDDTEAEAKELLMWIEKKVSYD